MKFDSFKSAREAREFLGVESLDILTTVTSTAYMLRAIVPYKGQILSGAMSVTRSEIDSVVLRELLGEKWKEMILEIEQKMQEVDDEEQRALALPPQ